MSATIDAVEAKNAHIRTMYAVLIVALMFMVFLWWGWKDSPRWIRVSMPPDLRSGAVLKPDEYNAATVAAFTTLYFQEVNRWQEDGEKDFPSVIHRNQAYFTPAYYDSLIEKMNTKHSDGELSGRQRFVIMEEGAQTYNSDSVKTLIDGSWVVDLQYTLVERMANLEVKRIKIKTPMRVVRLQINPESNVWGLALDGVPEGHLEEEIVDANL